MAISPEEANGVLSRAECLFDEQAVQTAIDKMVDAITADLSDKNPMVICVLTGGTIITSELLKRLKFPLELDYLHASRYGDKIVGETLHWYARPKMPLQNRHVLIVDDILDMGHTLKQIVEYCKAQQAADVKTAVLADKMHGMEKGLAQADYTGLELPDRYVFGYGMDYKHYWRNLTGIYAAGKDDE